MSPTLIIDGLQLRFPNTGLATATGELIRALAQNSRERIVVILPDDAALGEWDFAGLGVEFVTITAPHIRPDYLFRACWGWRVSVFLSRRFPRHRLFIPYLFNYGDCARNVVILPDLADRLVPDYGGPDAMRPWWQWRGRLPFRPLARRWEEWRFARARRVIVHSRFVRRQAEDILRIPSRRVVEISLASPSWLQRSADQSPRLHPEWPERFLLYVGGYALRKNVSLLLRAVGEAGRQEADLRCVFAGLSEERIRSDPELSAAWALPGVKAAAVLLPTVNNTDLADLYRLAQFTVYPSRAEGFGLPVVEAGVCERVCLCGDNSALVERQPDARFRLPTEDQVAWTERMLELWRDPEACQIAGQAAKKVADALSWTEAGRRLREVLLEE
jgi:glycosyltransferase involved in cell wall biosynthesis